MVFKVRINLNLATENEEDDLRYQFSEYFKKDYTFNMEVLEDNISEEDVLQTYKDYF